MKKGFKVVLIMLLVLAMPVIGAECASLGDISASKIQVQKAFFEYRAKVQLIRMDAVIEKQPSDEKTSLRNQLDGLIKETANGQDNPDFFDLQVQRAREIIKSFRGETKTKGSLLELKAFADQMIDSNSAALNVVLTKAFEKQGLHMMLELDKALCYYQNELSDKELKPNIKLMIENLEDMGRKRDNFKAAMDEAQKACGPIPLANCKEGEVLDFVNFAERIKNQFSIVDQTIKSNKQSDMWIKQIDEVVSVWEAAKVQVIELKNRQSYSKLEEAINQLETSINHAKEESDAGRYSKLEGTLRDIKRDLLILQGNIDEVKNEHIIEIKLEANLTDTTANLTNVTTNITTDVTNQTSANQTNSTGVQ